MIKDDPRRAALIMETQGGVLFMCLDGDVGKWGTPSKMGGTTYRLRKHR